MSAGYSGFWGFLYDWQNLVAGVLALIAGILAYCASQGQKEATERQTAHLQREAKRQMAREVIVSARLVDGVLGEIESDTDKLIKTARWASPSFGNDLVHDKTRSLSEGTRSRLSGTTSGGFGQTSYRPTWSSTKRSSSFTTQLSRGATGTARR